MFVRHGSARFRFLTRRSRREGPRGEGDVYRSIIYRTARRVQRKISSGSICSFVVIPAKAGIHSEYRSGIPNSCKKKGFSGAWIPPSAGMTVVNNVTKHQSESLPKSQ